MGPASVGLESVEVRSLQLTGRSSIPRTANRRLWQNDSAVVVLDFTEV